MIVCFKRIKKDSRSFFIWTLKKMGNLFCIFCNFLVRHMISFLFYKLTCSFSKRLKSNFTPINKQCFNENLFLKVSQTSPENNCVVSLFFYKVTGLQPSGLQHRCFLMNNTKFLRTPILKNICEPLTSAFFQLILWSSWKKTHSKNIVTEIH